jgi:hypothetical protein
MAMESRENKPTDHPKAEIALSAKDLCAMEMYFRERGTSEFLYDEKFDVFRFPEDGRFAFCEEFADWTLMRERGYLDF